MVGISFSYQAILGKYEPLVWPQMESLTVDLYLLVTKSFSARKLRFLRHKGYINVDEKLEMLATNISVKYMFLYIGRYKNFIYIGPI